MATVDWPVGCPDDDVVDPPEHATRTRASDAAATVQRMLQAVSRRDRPRKAGAPETEEPPR